MKSYIYLISLILIIGTTTTTINALRFEEFMGARLSGSNDKQRCGKQNNDALCPKSLCCSKYGFCGNKEFHCNEKYGCQHNCKKVKLTADKPKKSKPKSKTPQVIIKTISNPVPVCKNCGKKANAAARALAAAAANVLKKGPKKAKKRLEETSETISTVTPHSTEKKPSCSLKDGCGDIAAGSTQVASMLTKAKSMAHKIINQARKKALKIMHNKKPNKITVQVTGGAPLGVDHVENSFPGFKGFKIGGSVTEDDLLKKSGY